MLEVVTGLAVFAVVIVVGWLLVRTGGVPAGSDTVLTRVCFYAATPALLVTTIAGADLATVVSRDTLAGLLAEVLGILSAWAVHRLVLRRSVAEATIGALAAGYVNAANLGIPVLIVLLGDATAIAPILLLQLLVIAPVSFAILDWSTQADQGGASRAWLWAAPLRNPLLIGVLVGLVINLAGWDMRRWLGGLVVSSLHSLGALAVTVMMLSLGMSLAASSPKVTRRLTVQQVTRLTHQGPGGTASGESRTAPVQTASGDELNDVSERGAALWVSVGWKLVLVPLLAAALGWALGLRGEALLTPVTTASLPCAQNVFMYATRYGAAKPLARDCCLITTAGFVPVVLVAAAILR
ncbi:AEC family transporter [Actinomyces faecalis]|uniref:AEC family transporter n=1 Tax=Actinomyces faecalis TaxID=2722820 RepID=UPI001558144F|nr:AEC family transporter [Actinomyces faecalis]